MKTWNRRMYFALETLQVTARERRQVLGLALLGLALHGWRLLVPGPAVAGPATALPRPEVAARLARADSLRGLIEARYAPSPAPGPAEQASASPTDTTRPARPARGARAAKPPLQPVAINTATLEQLDALPGIGPALAARIIADRNTNGPFPAVDSLRRVRGIGPKLLERIRPYVH